MYIMTIKLQEATIKQFRSSTIQHSSDKHPEIILKPKGIIQKQVNSCHENSCPENNKHISNNHVANIISYTAVD